MSRMSAKVIFCGRFIDQKKAPSRWLASVQMASVMTLSPVVMTVTRIAIGSPPTVARVRVTGSVILAVCIRIELGAPAWIVNYVLRRGRAGKRD